MSRVLVTGGAGFIGSHLVDGLVADGFDVGILDDFSRAGLEYLSDRRGVLVHRGDITNLDFVRSVVREYEIVFHEAAIVGGGLSAANSLSMHATNVDGTLNLLEAAAESGSEWFVFASSASVYGEARTTPITENEIPDPMSAYAFSKLEGEKYCKFFGETYGLRTVCLRYFNVYGPRQKPGPYGGVISTFIHNLEKGEPPVIFGNGNQTRDFVNVRDVVKANLLVLKNKPDAGDVFNISTGKAVTVNELALKLCGLTGRTDLKPLHTYPRTGDIRQSCGDYRKAKEVLGYEPLVQLDEGLEELFGTAKPSQQVPPHSAQP